MPLGQTTNPVLLKAEQQVQAKIPQALKSAFNTTVQAGLTIMYSPALQKQRAARIQQSHNIAQDAGTGAARLMGELQKQAKGKIPAGIITACAVIFVCEYLDMVSKVKGVQITPQMVSQATGIAGQTMLQSSGMKPQDIQALVQSRAQGGQPTAAPSGGLVVNQMQAT